MMMMYGSLKVYNSANNTMCFLEYRWKAISKGKMMFYPGLRFPDGFRIQLLTKA